MASSILHGLAAQQLFAARRAKSPGARLPERCRPTNLEEALEIQQCVRLLVDDALGGWKCFVPGPDVVAAPIYASTIHTGSPCPVLARDGIARVEPEIAFVLAHDLPPRDKEYTDTENQGAITETRLVLELIGGRYAEPAAASFPELLADNLSNQGLFVGPLVGCNPDDLASQFHIGIQSSGELLNRCDGRHPDSHPLRTLRWLVRSLARRNETMTKGQIMITGSFSAVLDVPLGCPLCFKFGDLGCLHVQFVQDGCGLQIP